MARDRTPRNENAAARFYFTVNRRGQVLHMVERFDGTSWIKQQGTVVAQTVEEFRREYPNQPIRGVPDAYGKPGVNAAVLEGLSPRALARKLSEIDDMEELSALLTRVNGPTRQAVKRRLAEVYRQRLQMIGEPDPETVPASKSVTEPDAPAQA